MGMGIAGWSRIGEVDSEGSSIGVEGSVDTVSDGLEWCGSEGRAGEEVREVGGGRARMASETKASNSSWVMLEREEASIDSINEMAPF